MTGGLRGLQLQQPCALHSSSALELQNASRELKRLPDLCFGHEEADMLRVFCTQGGTENK